MSTETCPDCHRPDTSPPGFGCVTPRLHAPCASTYGPLLGSLHECQCLLPPHHQGDHACECWASWESGKQNAYGHDHEYDADDAVHEACMDCESNDPMRMCLLCLAYAAENGGAE